MYILKPEELRAKGNECVKDGKNTEALLHYSQAIKLDPKNHLLYSNRSLVFLKLQQYYYAMEDAKETIKLQPNWPKGHFRKGEVEYHVGNYTLSIMSYKQALLLDPNDQGIKDAITRTNREVTRIRKAERREPWFYAAGGALFGLFIVLGDAYLTKQPAIVGYVYRLIIVVLLGVFGLFVQKGYRYLKESQKESLLEPPLDLLKEMGADGSDDTMNDSSGDKQDEKKSYKRRSTGQARQRYRMGKS